MDSKVAQAISLIQAGDKVSGGKILADLIKHEPDNEWAWYWLSVCVKPVAQKRNCLNRVLQINPSNIKAQQALSRLDSLDRIGYLFGWFLENKIRLGVGLGVLILGVVALVVLTFIRISQVSAAQGSSTPKTEIVLAVSTPNQKIKNMPTSIPAPTRATKFTPVPAYDAKNSNGSAEYNLPPAPKGFSWKVIPNLLMNTLVPDGWYFTQTEDDIDAFFVTKEILNADGEFSTGMAVSIYRDVDDVHQAAQDMIFDVTNRTTTVRVVDSMKLDSKTQTVTMYSVLITEEFPDKNPDDPNYRKRRVFDAIADTFKNTLYIIEFECPQEDWDNEWNARGGPVTLSVINLLFAWR